MKSALAMLGIISVRGFVLSYGEDFLRKLLRDQKIVFTRDRRQLTEWVVRGRYPIGIALPTDLLKGFQEKGMGKNVKPLDDPTFMESLIPGFGAVGVMNRRPHPNAAKVYLNWLLSRDGQSSWVTKTATRNSRRLDVAVGNPDNAMKPNKKYIQAQTEKVNPKREAVMKIATEIIAD
jgi:iron(III) transport system substrate-binding protein